MDDTRLRLPRPDRIPNVSNLRIVPEIDTGAAFRPDWRKQDPSADPKEPYSGESSGTGTDHSWSNCTMTSAALAYAYQIRDKSGPWGGDMRHHQDDLTGGTDLYDACTAWSRFGGQSLTIKIGDGWGAVKAAHNEGRAVIIQGEGNVPGSESFDGGHACIIGIETASDGKWLFGDPLASGWQWVTESSIRDWAENLSSGIYFAVSAVSAVEDDMDITQIKGEDWQAKNGVLRKQPDTAAEKITTVPAGTIMRSIAEVSSAGSAYSWRLTEYNGAPAYFVYKHLADNSIPDWQPVSSPGVDAALSDYIARKPIDTDVGDAIAQRDAEWIDHLTPD